MQEDITKLNLQKDCAKVGVMLNWWQGGNKYHSLFLGAINQSYKISQ
jgi:hypothetical protein